MRYALLLLLMLLPAQALWALSPAETRHLLVRSGFDDSPEVYQTWLALAREDAVARLLSSTTTEPVVPPPDWALQPVLGIYKEVQRTGEPRRDVAQRVRQQQGIWQRELEDWVLANAVLGHNPLAERMTAFWHNHFVSSSGKVKNAQLLYRQHRFLRAHALGNFGDLLQGVVRDPAMLLYLDNRQNRKGHPNENLAREILELFSMGEGHYSEQDIREGARALTGWSIDGDMAFQVRKKQHDDGLKTIFGQHGRFDGDDLVRLILQQPATAEFIVSKLWREFISPEPDVILVQAWAREFREHNYAIQPLLRRLFNSDAFWHPENRGVLIKSPLQLLAGTARAFSAQPRDYRPWVVAMRRMGQWPLNPPNVKGWAGQEDWIDASRWLTRRSFLTRLLSAPPSPQAGMKPVGMKRTDASAWAAYGENLPLAQLQDFLLPLSPAEPPGKRANRESTVRHWTLDPVYHLY